MAYPLGKFQFPIGRMTVSYNDTNSFPVRDYSFPVRKPLFPHRGNFSFKPQKLNVLPIETNQRYYQFKESIKRSHKDIIIPMLQINYLQQVSATL